MGTRASATARLRSAGSRCGASDDEQRSADEPNEPTRETSEASE
jgi:hypothetical protein